MAYTVLDSIQTKEKTIFSLRTSHNVMKSPAHHKWRDSGNMARQNLKKRVGRVSNIPPHVTMISFDFTDVPTMSFGSVLGGFSFADLAKNSQGFAFGSQGLHPCRH